MRSALTLVLCFSEFRTIRWENTVVEGIDTLPNPQTLLDNPKAQLSTSAD